MTYVEAASAPLRKTGQIKLYGPEGFAGMRRAGRLVAECLDLLAGEVCPGVSTARLDALAFEFAMDHGSLPATWGWRFRDWQELVAVATSTYIIPSASMINGCMG